METRTVTDSEGNSFEAFVLPISCAKCGASGEVVVDKQLAELDGNPEGFVRSHADLILSECCTVTLEG